MKRHWPVLLLVLLAIIGIRRQLVRKASRDEARQLVSQLNALSSPSTATVSTATTEIDPSELQALRAHASRVHQLRGEVTLAQQRFDNLAPVITNLASKVHARTNQAGQEPVPEFPPGYIPRHKLADRGNATPDAALESFWWAMSHGNGTRVYSLAAEMTGKSVPEDAAKETEGFLKLFRNFPGYRIIRRENFGSDHLVLGLETAPGAKAVNVRLLYTNDQWYVSMDSLNDSFRF